MTDAAPRRGSGPLLAVALAVGAGLLPVGGLFAAREFTPMSLYTMESASMEPAIRRGDTVLVNAGRGLCAGGLIFRGAVVLVRRPGAAPVFRRLVGLPGETVATRRGMAWVGGRPLATGTRVAVPAVEGGTRGGRDLAVESDGAGRTWRAVPADPSVTPDAAPRRLGAGEVFALGDNRAQADDSRTTGPVRVTDVCGAATRIVVLGPGSTPDRLGRAP